VITTPLAQLVGILGSAPVFRFADPRLTTWLCRHPVATQRTRPKAIRRWLQLWLHIPGASSRPESASRSVLARPRVKCTSSRVTRNDGHIVPASNLRQCPLLLHISAALAKPPVASPPVPGSLRRSVRGSFSTFHADQSSAGL